MNIQTCDYLHTESEAFDQIGTKYKKLEENDLSLARTYSIEITKLYRAFVKETNYPEGYNLSMFRMQPSPTEYLDAQDVEMGKGRKYLLFSCPSNAIQAGLLFDAALQAGVSLFVSLLESTEAPELFNNYWQQDQLEQIHTPAGWQFAKVGSRVIAVDLQIADGMSSPTIIETLISARNINGEARTLRHLHYEHWQDQTRVPSMPLFQLLLDRIDELQGSSDRPFAINCFGGVGRTGTAALSHYLRREVDALLVRECDVYKEEINIPRLIFEFKKQRNGYFLNFPGQIADVYSILDQYIIKKVKEDGEFRSLAQAFAGMRISPISSPVHVDND